MSSGSREAEFIPPQSHPAASDFSPLFCSRGTPQPPLHQLPRLQPANTATEGLAKLQVLTLCPWGGAAESELPTSSPAFFPDTQCHVGLFCSSLLKLCRQRARRAFVPPPPSAPRALGPPGHVTSPPLHWGQVLWPHLPRNHDARNAQASTARAPGLYFHLSRGLSAGCQGTSDLT